MPAGEIVDNNAPIQSDMDILNDPALDERIANLEEEDEKVVEKKSNKVKSPTQDEDDEDLDEDELDEDTEEDTEEEEKDEEDKDKDEKKFSESDPVTVKDLKEKYPEIFKQFPNLRATIFREKEYQNLFPTIEVAKEAQENNQNFTELRNSIFNEDGKSFVKALKDADGLTKFSSEFLGNLAEADKETHWKVIAPIFQNLVRTVTGIAGRAGNTNLKNSAAWIADYLFGAGGMGEQIDPAVLEILEGKRSVIQEEKKEDPNSKSVKELNDLKIERFKEFKTDINSSVKSELTTKVTKELSKYQLSKVEIRALTAEIIDEIGTGLQADASYMSKIGGMWNNATKNGFKSTDKASIINAALARASDLLPSIKRKKVAEALETSPKELDKRRAKIEETNSRREPGSSGKAGTRNNNSTPSNPKQINWSKTSDLDMLNGKITYKG